jgi:hypothetical protein
MAANDLSHDRLYNTSLYRHTSWLQQHSEKGDTRYHRGCFLVGFLAILEFGHRDDLRSDGMPRAHQRDMMYLHCISGEEI